jgi:hypothetical protein
MRLVYFLSINVLVLSFLIRVDKNADGRIGEEEVKEVSNKYPCPMVVLGVGGAALQAVSFPFL